MCLLWQQIEYEKGMVSLNSAANSQMIQTSQKQ